jgi:hypothetical protein
MIVGLTLDVQSIVFYICPFKNTYPASDRTGGTVRGNVSVLVDAFSVFTLKVRRRAHEGLLVFLGVSMFDKRVKFQQVLNSTLQHGTQLTENVNIQTGNIIFTVVVNLLPVHLSFVGKFIFAKPLLL